ncbi:MAG: methyltransferase domain-containing protein [Archaeoglobaceae archaeon]|nr:methyltransferase domain-containing protein [Archaeoglobaceae archaeon]MDW7989370.1 methyltransferase domain-containing protein [Archaeoglobaceae archaeon]
MPLLDDKRRARKLYKYFSLIYDYVNPIFYSKEMRKKVVEMAELNRDSLVLEVGSGTGFTTEEIAKIVPLDNIFCVDITPEQIKRAKAKMNAKFVIGDAENLPFKDKIFDSAISAGSIEYWPNPLRGIEEMVRVTKSGGKIVILAPRRPKNSLIRKFAEKIMLFPSTDDCITWFKKAGLKSIDFVETGPYSFWSKLVLIISGRVP